MKKILPFVFLFIFSNLDAQNVGIGNTNPSEKLDVSGNVNITGTIKTNGIDGQPNQVLMKDNTGSLAWGDLSQFKNGIVFLNSGSWIVPAGITKIATEAWGGGGGSTNFNAGGGGGYIYAERTLTPGTTINITIGAGGVGNSSITGSVQATSGGVTTVGSVSAYGGAGGSYSVSVSNGFNSQGGTYVGDLSLYFYGITGQTGTANSHLYEQFAAGVFYDIETCGKGGDAGNSFNTGGAGGLQVYNTTSSTYVTTINSLGGTVPGGGAGAGFKRGGAAYNGANGMVIIHY